MTDPSLLTTLLPIRDSRERLIAYELRTHPGATVAANDIDAEAHAVLALLRTRDLLRLARPLPLHVPITPGVLRSGAITGFASADVVFTLAVDALDDAEARRAVERFAATEFRFAFVVNLTNLRLPQLTGPLAGSWMVFDASAIDGRLATTNVVQRLLATGARAMARHVDDRATRERLRAGGVVAFTGQALPRGGGASPGARRRALDALRHLERLADGRPVDSEVEAFMAADAEMTEAVLRPLGASGTGAARPRTLGQVVMRSGREALADRLMVGTAFLLAESAGTLDLANVAIARARMLQRLGTALEKTGHPRGHLAAGVLSCAEHALGVPAAALADTLALGPLMRDVVMARRSPLGMLVDLVEAYESGWWDDLLSYTDQLGIAPGVVAEAWHVARLDAREEVAARPAGDA